MANSAYEYVKQFELPDTLLPLSWIVVRVDGHHFHAFSADHRWEKPNDRRALSLMNDCAQAVMAHYNDIVIAIGMSDEFSFVIHPQSTLYHRRASKLLSTIVSAFTAQFVFRWSHYFPDTPLMYPPHFDSRCVVYPTDATVRDYLCWRQVDCHINNLYNTTFWMLVQRGGMTVQAAQSLLKDTDSAKKNEILFQQFGINYNNQPAIERKGSILVWERYQRSASDSDNECHGNSDSGDSTLASPPRTRRRVVVIHDDLIAPSFYTKYPGIVPYVSGTEFRKAAKEEEKKLKKQAHKARRQTFDTSRNESILLPPLSSSTPLTHSPIKEENANDNEDDDSSDDECDSPRPSSAFPLLAESPSPRSHPGFQFLNKRRLSIATLSPRPSPTPPDQSPPPTSQSPSQSPPPSSPQPRHQRNMSINPSELYHNIVVRAFSDTNSNGTADAILRATSVPCSPSVTTELPQQPVLPYSQTATLPSHRRLHKSGFISLVVDEVNEADPQAEDAGVTPVAAASVPMTALSSTAPPRHRAKQQSLAFEIVSTPSSQQPGSFFSTPGQSTVTSPTNTSRSIAADTVDVESVSASLPRQSSLHIQTSAQMGRVGSVGGHRASIFNDASPSLPPSPPVSHRDSEIAHVEHLFDHFLVLGCIPDTTALSSKPQSWIEDPRILLEFPQSASHNTVHADELASFAFPVGVRLERVPHDVNTPMIGSMLYGQRQFQRGENVHCFIIKNHSKAVSQLFTEDVRYGLCVIARESTNLRDIDGNNHQLNCPTAYCFISQWPYLWLHAEVLFSLLMLLHLKRASVLATLDSREATSVKSKPLGPHQVSACVKLLKRYHALRIPAPGDGFILDVSPTLPPIDFERPTISDREEEISSNCQSWALCLAWTFVSAEMIVDMIELMLRETKIIVVDPNLAMLSSAVLSFIPLIRPLTWTSVLLPVLPYKMHDFLDAPVPILVGVPDLPERLCAQKHLDSNTAVWFPSGNKLWLPQGFRSLLPQRSKLVNGVKKHLLALRKSKPALVPGKTTPSSLQYKASDAEQPMYAVLLAETRNYIEMLADYVANTELGRLPRDKEREPFAQVLKQTQMMQHYMQRRSDAPTHRISISHI